MQANHVQSLAIPRTLPETPLNLAARRAFQRNHRSGDLPLTRISTPRENTHDVPKSRIRGGGSRIGSHSITTIPSPIPLCALCASVVNPLRGLEFGVQGFGNSEHNRPRSPF